MMLTPEQRVSWSRPEAEDLGGGVFRLPLPLPNDGLRAVNVYAVVSGEGLTLIDGGWALEESRALLVSYLSVLGRALGDIQQFLITHVHRDHYSQALAIRGAHGTRVFLGENERSNVQAMIEVASGRSEPALRRRLRRAGGAELLTGMGGAMTGAAAISDDLAQMPDRWLSDGMEIDLQDRTLRVIATPGHTNGHVVFLDAPAGFLFAGDHLLPHITPSVGFEPAPVALPLVDYLSSLALIRSMPDARLLPAHGPVVPSAHERAEDLLRHHEDRLTVIEQAVLRGAGTAYEAAKATTWTRHERKFADLSLLDQMLAALEAAAHLDVLVARRVLTATDTEAGITVYQALPARLAEK